MNTITNFIHCAKAGTYMIWSGIGYFFGRYDAAIVITLTNEKCKSSVYTNNATSMDVAQMLHSGVKNAQSIFGPGDNGC